MGDSTDKTTFKGKIGIQLNIVYDDGDRLTKMYEIDLPPKYFGNLSARRDSQDDFFEKGDFMLVDTITNTGSNQFAPQQNTNQAGQLNVILQPEIEKKMRQYVREVMFNQGLRTTYFTRDTSPFEDNPYFHYVPVAQRFNYFYIYAGSPADKWIEGMYAPPFDHTAPAEFGVSFTLIRKLRQKVLQGGNPKVEFIAQMFSAATNDFVQKFRTDTINFGGDLLTTDFGFRNKEYILSRPKPERGYGLPSDKSSLYFYEGQRKDEFFEFVKQRIDAKYKGAFVAEPASPDGEFFVYPNSLIEEWIINGEDDVFAPNMALSVKVMLREPTEEEKADQGKEKPAEAPKPDYRYQEPSTASGRFEGVGKIEIEGQDETNEYLRSEISKFYELDYQELDKARGAYIKRDRDNNGDFKEGKDIFGTKQGQRVPMEDTASYANRRQFQEDAPADLYRVFDTYDNLSEETDKDIAESITITKYELNEFNEYSSIEAYMDEAQFDSESGGGFFPYDDGRKDSYLVSYNNAEARIYEYYDEYYKDQRLVIAFRGTQFPYNPLNYSDFTAGLDDLITDADIKTHPLTYIGINTDNPEAMGIVHQGFADYVNNLYDKLTQTIKTFKGFYPRGKVFICGHSLGAVAALIFSYMIFMRENITPDRIYQFGAPMGIWTFGDHINKNLPIINVFHQYDVIPPVSALFKQHGVKLVFDGDNNLTPYAVNQEVPGYDIAGVDNPMAMSARLVVALKLNSAFQPNTSTLEQITGIEKLRQTGIGDTAASILKAGWEKMVAVSNYLSGYQQYYTEINDNLMLEVQRQGIIQSSQKAGLNVLSQRFYHTSYRRTIDEWKNKSIEIPNFRYRDKLFKHDPNPRGYHHDHDYTYHSSIDGQHLYMDANGDFFMGVDTPSSLAFHPLNNTEPLGLIFYDKNKNDLANKSIVFYS